MYVISSNSKFHISVNMNKDTGYQPSLTGKCTPVVNNLAIHWGTINPQKEAQTYTNSKTGWWNTTPAKVNSSTNIIKEHHDDDMNLLHYWVHDLSFLLFNSCCNGRFVSTAWIKISKWEKKHKKAHCPTDIPHFMYPHFSKCIALIKLCSLWHWEDNSYFPIYFPMRWIFISLVPQVIG